ncbi:THO complex subunit 3 [Psilocybe cubensis]|uniref:THO complex subunit 3 n=2 Tax=Psilocybe cubensis TaxID=181762 RepID=A0ACB8H4T3_PSICU|nr:THO complex subunit 3 [Psilocybe cubensis]KAH9482501.1 THO complex subunit 3 [Psilocybe cubensis]
MSQPLPAASSKEEDEIPIPERPPSPPLHTTFAARGIHPPTFSAFKPRDYRFTSSQAMTHVAWSCDGKKLAAVGIDKLTRVWNPEKSMDSRSASVYSGGHSDDVDYVSWNPTHPELFCTSSTRDRRIVFWDARQSRYTQQVSVKVPPAQTIYTPDGRSLGYISAMNQLFFLNYGKSSEESSKEEWHMSNLEPQTANSIVFSATGESLVLAYHGNHTLCIMDYPSLNVVDKPPAHVGGCLAVALDPRGRYLASGGYDSIIDLFDLDEWICARTISACENVINALSFSHDGEYLAVASAGSYIDICATETGAPLHRVPALAPSPTVSWHPSKYVIAYCGQTKAKENPTVAPVAVISMFGLLE